MNAIIALKKAKDYTDESLLGGGAVAGKNCTISSIELIEGGNRVTFSWTLDDGTVKTKTMDVMDGTIGEDGASPTISAERNSTDNGVDIIVTNSDGTTSTATVYDGNSAEPTIIDERLVFNNNSNASVVGEILKI